MFDEFSHTVKELFPKYFRNLRIIVVKEALTGSQKISSSNILWESVKTERDMCGGEGSRFGILTSESPVMVLPVPE